MPRFIFLALFSTSLSLSAQDCGCTIAEVMDNTVTPCTVTIGEEIIVGSVPEFYSALGQANSQGGNMTILMEDGIYSVASTGQYPYITASNLVIRSLSGARDAVILTGQGMQSVEPSTEIGIYAVGDNITIADLTIRDVGNHGIAVTGDGLSVHNVRIQDTYEQMIKGNSSGDGADQGIVQCSLFEYTAGIGPQWYIGGLDIHEGNDWVVSDNVFLDIAAPSITQAEHAVHFWDNSGENTVERNIIIGCDRGIGFGLGSSPNSGGIIRNNMIYNDGSDPYADVGIGLETSPGTSVYHNTIIIQYQNAIEYRFVATSGVDIANNLCNQDIASRNGGTATLTTNIESAPTGWFVDAVDGDLRLSTALVEVSDQGTTLVDVTDDIDKTSRPQGAGADIGAHEWVTENGCPADLNESGAVDINDFILFNSSYNSDCNGCVADINDDAEVDVDDFLILNSSFGEVCE